MDSIGSSSTVRRDANNLVTTQTDARGHDTLFTYDERGNLKSVTDEVSIGKELFAGRTFPTGAGPSSVASGDVNGDGVVDLVTANFDSGSGNSISVFLGKGDGSFSTKVDYTVGIGPAFVKIADVNLDGKLDILTANRGSFVQAGDTVSILSGDGTGSFVLAQSVTVGQAPTSLALGDLDVDGDLDMVVSNSNDNTVTVLMRSASGFAKLADVTVGSQPLWVTLADLNKDGRLDLSTANSDLNAPSVSVRMGNGNGTFGPRSDIAFDNFVTPVFITSADLNGDGNLDLITGGSQVSVLPASASSSPETTTSVWVINCAARWVKAA